MNSSLECVLVIPVYNEEGCLKKVIEDWHQSFKNYFNNNFRIIAIDDGSRDRSLQILAQLAKEHEQIIVHCQANAGHGAAIVAGYEKAIELNPKYVFQVDSDDQIKAADFAPIWKARFDNDFTFGFRQNRKDPQSRIATSLILRLTLLILHRVRIVDPNIPFRLMKTDVLKEFLQQVPRNVFAPNIFLSLLAAKSHKLSQTIPVSHVERTSGKGTLNKWKLFKVSLRSFWELLRF